ncbi:TPMT family class I SAM-dependent methyltransferase [Kribbella sp. NBC_01245]|uniref:class I SAM-dependent methyltransferase n=1 Tax=Kribbella sp. NBC_01245 TaxID=2903578 RepID=UPI002E2E287A|nr:methyltransferase domain-containing protein [Kribbella sp. NBC_01245]
MAEQAETHHGFDKEYWEQHWQQNRTGSPGSMGTNPPNPHLVREVGGLMPGTALDAGCGAGTEAIWLASQGWQVTAADLSTEALTRAAAHAATTESAAHAATSESAAHAAMSESADRAAVSGAVDHAARSESADRAATSESADRAATSETADRAATSETADRAAMSGVSERVRWVEADLSVWDPGTRFDLVTTHYAHPAMPQLEFYDRIAEWVAPGGTLLIVGHLHTHSAPTDAHGHSHGKSAHAHGHGKTADDHGHGKTADGHSKTADGGGDSATDGGRSDGDGHQPPVEASATVAAITARLDDTAWVIVTAEERHRTLAGPGGREVPLHDVVVRATRRN